MAVILSRREISNPGVVEQARYELLKAVDQGGEAGRARPDTGPDAKGADGIVNVIGR